MLRALLLASAVLGLLLASAPALAEVQVAAAPAGCPAGTICVDVHPAQPLGPVDLIAQGLLFGADSTTNQGLVNALHPTSWRLSAPGQNYSVAHASGAPITIVLSNRWYDEHGPSQPPWANWPAYAAWLRATVTATVASGQEPAYWEVQNEPDGGYQALPPENTNQALYQYQLASTIIRSLDPHARIEGPSLLGYYDTPGQPTLDMRTFLSFVNANNLPLDAVSWHEVIGTAVNQNPDVVASHVARARALLAQFPRLAHLPIFINEYQSNDTHLIPGWAVGWIASLEQSGAASATRACWHEPDVGGHMIAECNEGSLDGLLQPGSGLPQDLYWVHLDYAQMTGRRVAVTTSNSSVTAYATYDPSQDQIKVLIGRHVSCTAAVRVDCRQPASATPGPVPVIVRVDVPTGWGDTVVSAARIPNAVGPMAPPIPISAVVGATQHLSIPVGNPTFADGDAYQLSVAPLWALATPTSKSGLRYPVPAMSRA